MSWPLQNAVLQHLCTQPVFRSDISGLVDNPQVTKFPLPADSSPQNVESQRDLSAWALAAVTRLLRSHAGTAGTQPAAAQKTAAADLWNYIAAQMAAADELSAGEVLAAAGSTTNIDKAARSAVVQQLQSALHLAAAAALGLDLDDFDSPAELFEWITEEAVAIADRAEADSTALNAAREAERVDIPVQLPEGVSEVLLEEEELPFVLKMLRLSQDTSSQSKSAVVGKLQPQQPAPLATDSGMRSSSAAKETIQQVSHAQMALPQVGTACVAHAMDCWTMPEPGCLLLKFVGGQRVGFLPLRVCDVWGRGSTPPA